MTKFIAGALAAGIVVGAAGVRQVKKGVGEGGSDYSVRDFLQQPVCFQPTE